MRVNDSELLLNWLQDLYNNKIDILVLPNTISDSEIDPDCLFEKISSKIGIFKLYTVGNPGWNLEFYYNNLYLSNAWVEIDINTGINLTDQNSDKWFCAQKFENNFDSGGGPLYLSLCLEAFRCFIEQEELIIDDLTAFREKLKTNNTLLCWLEEFYFSYCGRDEYDYGYSDISISLISVQAGWVMVFLLEELELDNSFKKVFIKESEGEIECYMLGSQFIIRAHHRGLITGIKIFKEWIESQPEYKEKRKYID